MTHSIMLNGCAPLPLSNYLKALGLLRLVATQVDTDAAGHWRDERFILRSRLDYSGIRHFLLQDYRPTPVMAPWNGGSGFFYRETREKRKDPDSGKIVSKVIGRNKPTTATKCLEQMRSSAAARFADYRDSLENARQVLDQLGLDEAPGSDTKGQLIQMLRNTLPDVALPWLDAAIVLTADKLAFPPLLGSGGNDGNLDFSTNFIQRLVDLFELESGDPGAMAGHWLDESLQGGAGFGLVVDLAIGQFNPGAVGGPNATTGFEAASLVNPWDYVLLVEGAVLFAAAATRRLESAGMSAFSYPFTVFSASGGSGSIALSDASSARSEMWLPLWEQPADYRALQALLSEGRAMVGRRPARDGLDMARAIAGLGVDRGIRAFHRYGFLKRSGKSHLAAPLSRFHVQRNPRADLIVDLDRHGWLGNLRRLARQQETPSRLSQQAVRLENALFAATQVTAPEPLQATLIALGKLQLYLARSPKYWQKIQPVPTLRSDWITLADDGSHEFRLAAALASLSQPPLREYLFPVTEEAWNAETRRAVWAERQLSANLVAVLARRLLEADRSGAADKPLGGGLGADQAAVAAFLRGAVNDARLSALVVGLALARTPRSLEKRKSAVDHLPGAYAVFKPLFVPDGLLHRFGVLPRDRKLPIPPGLIARLASGDVNAALRQARQRARGSSIPMLGAMVPDGTPLDGARLAAALMVPIEAKLLRRLLDRAYPGKISETESTTTKSQ